MSQIQSLQKAATSLNASDLSWANQVLEKLKGNKEEISNFSTAPEKYIRALGYELPDGFHVHYIDENGIYYPNEVNSAPSSSGVRVEARIDHNNTALGVCIYCPGGCGKQMGI